MAATKINRSTKENLTVSKPEYRTVPIDSVKEWKANPHVASEEDIDKLAELIKTHGQRTPINVWKNNNVIYKGNTTWKAMKSLGFTEVVVAFHDFKSEKDAIEYGIADNVPHKWFEFDDKLLAKLTSGDDFSFSRAGLLAGKNMHFEEQEIEAIPESTQVQDSPMQAIEKIDKGASILAGHSDNYKEFLEAKLPLIQAKGFDVQLTDINNVLMPFQKDVVRWAVKRGRAAVFSGTGTGKTLIQLEWGRLLLNKIKKPILMLCPLAVAQQTIKEAQDKLKLQVILWKPGINLPPNLFITNYQKLENMDVSKFGAVILDESSVIKNFEGALRILILEKFAETPYKLCCTATPAPNDYMELGTHAEFLGVMKRQEMLSMYFVHDGVRTSNWRLKGHAKEDFYKWMASWSVMFRSPRDLGYNDDSIKFFDLPKITYKQHIVETNQGDIADKGIKGRIQKRQSTIEDRANAVVEIMSRLPKDEPCVVWCDLNPESEAVSTLTGITEIRGNDSDEVKERNLNDFSFQRIGRIVTKPSIAGFGLNWQHCGIMIFLGLSDSFERYYQAIRRMWRAGRKKEVKVYIVISNIERNVLNNIQRKEAEFNKLQEEMIEIMAPAIIDNIKLQKEVETVYKTAQVKGKDYALYMGDCVDVVKTMKENSIDFSVFSPPFASLYTYSDSVRDMGNCVDHAQFFIHFKFLVKELYRILNPGRNIAVHCMNLPTSKVRNGYIGIVDFRGAIIKAFEEFGFIYHSEVTIWKNPVTVMQRTKALGLLHKQLKKDSCMSRHGIPDYVVVFRKPGENKSRVTHTDVSFPVKGTDGWQEIASPVYILQEDGTFHSAYENPPPYFGCWMNINPSDTLQKTSAREYEDERHIAPLQLSVIERCLKLWSRPNDTVLSPFMGIGSEGVKSLEMGRKFVGIELKESYFKQAKANIELKVKE